MSSYNVKQSVFFNDAISRSNCQTGLAVHSLQDAVTQDKKRGSVSQSTMKIIPKQGDSFKF